MIVSSLVVAAAAVSLLELDAASLGQTMISRPAVFAPALGAAFGQSEVGAGFGILWELLSLDDAPIGGFLPINATAAAGATLLLCLGAEPVAPEAALPVGLAVGWLHRRLEVALRRARANCAQRCEGRMASGRPPRLGGVAFRELGKQALMTFLLLAAVLSMRPWLSLAWPLTAPPTLQTALTAAMAVCPWIGCAALLHRQRTAA